MAAIDRVMRAYAKKHELSPDQAAFVRKELAEFIGLLMSAPWREPLKIVKEATKSDLGGAQADSVSCSRQ